MKKLKLWIRSKSFRLTGWFDDQWQRSWTKRKVRDQKGVAILLAITTLTMMLYLAMEVQYDTQVEYIVNSQSVNRLKAYYAARSGIELSLLRIKVFQSVKGTLGQQMGPAASLLNLIWNFPFAWPPVLPPGVDQVNQDMIDTAVKEAMMDASYQSSISDEGTKIDINDLDSTSKAIRDATRKIILQIFENETTNDTAFGRKYRDTRYEELVDRITDWIDGDTTSKAGGDEAAAYTDFPPEERMPPNRAFRTVDELRLVPGINDEIFNLLKDRITVYGAKAINPNTASSEVIQSIDPSITNEVVTEVLKRRGDPMNMFRDANDFWTFIQGKGARVSDEVIKNTPIVTDVAFNFRIKSIGSYGNSVREIEAIVYDIPQTAKIIAERIKKELQTTGGTAGTPPPSTQAQQPQTPTKGPPRIVYWFEK